MTTSTLWCPGCGAELALEAARFNCDCGDLFEVRHPFESSVDTAVFDERRSTREGIDASGVWRFREVVDPGLAGSVVSLGEGDTPLYDTPGMARFVGAGALRLKHEGANPTGSFKDRGMTVALSRALRSGAKRVACASTGNTAASLAAFAARAGVEAVVLVPKGVTALGKLSQALAYGARTLEVRGSFDDAMTLVRELALEGEVALLNSINPFRLEGQKTIVFEILQELGWSAPDWLVFPAGNLGNCAAFGKALVEARDLGWIDRLPRLAAVQAEGAAPFAAAFERGFDALVSVEPETIATAIRIGDPVSYPRAVRSIRATNGTVLAVSDADILRAKEAVDAAGIGAEPASCASVAGAKALVERGVIGSDDSVVCVLTGHLLKDPETTLAYHRGELGESAADGRRFVTVDASAEALRAALA